MGVYRLLIVLVIFIDLRSNSKFIVKLIIRFSLIIYPVHGWIRTNHQIGPVLKTPVFSLYFLEIRLAPPTINEVFNKLIIDRIAFISLSPNSVFVENRQTSGTRSKQEVSIIHQDIATC